ncbi:MAG: autotransporter-associated beta strand repeat-containing protein [Verrucomicrobiota bacterium]
MAITGAITDAAGATSTAVTQGGVGTVILSNVANTYKGVTTIGSGILEVTKLAAGGSNSSIGLSSNASTNLIIGNAAAATLRYAGTGDSTDRQFTVGTLGATLDASGTGAINFTNTAAVTLTTPATARTLTLTGNNTSANTLAAAIADGAGGGTVSLSKSGTGTWVVSGANTYTGTTTIGSGGTLQIGSAGTSGSLGGGAVTNNATLEFNRTDSYGGTVSNAIGGTGAVKLSGGTLTLGGTNTYSGATTITSGTLLVSGTGSINSTSGVTVSSGTTFRYNSTTAYSGGAIANSGVVSGSGNLGTAVLGGSGSIDPGNSPGILTAGSTNPTGGLAYNFEFTVKNANPTWGNATNSGNDVLRLTGGTPFSAALTSGNTVSMYLNVSSLAANDVFTGGFYTDHNATFTSNIAGATFKYYLYSATGGTTYNGVKYDLYSGSLTFNVDTLAKSADFGSGPISGYSMEFTAVPEPATWALLAFSLTTVMVLRRRRNS